MRVRRLKEEHAEQGQQQQGDRDGGDRDHHRANKGTHRTRALRLFGVAAPHRLSLTLALIELVGPGRLKRRWRMSGRRCPCRTGGRIDPRQLLAEHLESRKPGIRALAPNQIVARQFSGLYQMQQNILGDRTFRLLLL